MNVYEWLKGLPNVTLAAPIAVKIGRATYHGASYFDRDQPSQPILYLLGNVPAAYRRSSRVCWRFPGEQADWYLAAFADAAIAAAIPDMHPFGAWFQLRQWPLGRETIDAIHERPYRRLQMTEVY